MSVYQLQKTYIRQCYINHTKSIATLSKLKELKTDLKLNVMHEKQEEPRYEVVLSIEINIQHEDNLVASLQLQQAGIFKIEGYAKEALELLLNAYCPSLLFPYLRQKVAVLSREAGLSTIELPLMDFNAIYQQQKQQAQQKSDEQAQQQAEEKKVEAA